VTLSVVIIAFNEEANLPRTLESVRWADEIIVVDSGSTDRTVEIARSYNAKVWVESWKGFAAQKNSAIDKATGHWILSLDADEEVSTELAVQIQILLGKRKWEDGDPEFLASRDPVESQRMISDKNVDSPDTVEQQMALEGLARNAALSDGYMIARRNLFLGRFIRHGGFYPDAKLRLFRRGAAHFESRLVHEGAKLNGVAGKLSGDLLHHAYPTLSSYLEHMNRYSSLGAEMAVSNGRRGFSFINIVLRPIFTFIYNYFFRLGFLDGHEGLLLHVYHSVYVSWKYAKLWELSRKSR
jgi:glycosyltransferase involved in cell wall biosynthesis